MNFQTSYVLIAGILFSVLVKGGCVHTKSSHIVPLELTMCYALVY